MDYLHWHRNQWRVRMVVPPEVIAKIGIRHLLHSTGTTDLDRAKKIAAPVIKQFQRRIEQARHGWSGRGSHAGLRRHRILSMRILDLSKTTCEWWTPPRPFECMQVEFDMDVCSPGADRVPWIPAKVHLTVKDDGLATRWVGFCWMNPPFGIRAGMQLWLDKFAAHDNGVALVPARPATKWWQEFTSKADLLLFISPRLHFIRSEPGHSHTSTDQVLVAFGPRAVAALRTAAANGLGRCVPARDL